MTDKLERVPQASIPSRCVECGAALVSPIVCIACPDLRPPRQDLDHFVRLGMERAFDIDLDELERRYLFLARSLHPDQFARRTPEERAIAEQVSAQLNDSYRALRDPVRRAEYLLTLEGGPNREEDKRTPKAFLIEMLELNEEIEEAEAELDSGNEVDAARARLTTTKDGIAARAESVVKSLSLAFRELTAAGADEARRAAKILEIREKLNVCAYLQGAVAQIRELLLR